MSREQYTVVKGCEGAEERLFLEENLLAMEWWNRAFLPKNAEGIWMERGKNLTNHLRLVLYVLNIYILYYTSF